MDLRLHKFECKEKPAHHLSTSHSHPLQMHKKTSTPITSQVMPASKNVGKVAAEKTIIDKAATKETMLRVVNRLAIRFKRKF